MELFYTQQADDRFCRLDPEESVHCVKVLRHRIGDEIDIVDGAGTLYHCQVTAADPRRVEAMVLSAEPDWGGHPYHLTLAVCPTKNNDRYEWFAEKAVEVGVDRICPVIGDRSERRVFKTDRIRRILVSAMKQSLKARLPQVDEPVSVRDFITSCASGEPAEASLRLIACCFEEEGCPRRSVKEVLGGYVGSEIVMLIGPEGDFSPEEVRLAVDAGFVPVHLGPSRLRTETAAVTAAEAVYFNYL